MPPKLKPKRHASRRRLRQLALANLRQTLRRDAVKELNTLGSELLPANLHIPTKVLLSTEPRVERLIRALEPRCQTPALSARLRAATAKWSENSGLLSQAMTPNPVRRRMRGKKSPGVHSSSSGNAGVDEEDEELPRILPQHQVLKRGYILQSKAFMLTYNSDTFTRDTWATFLKWVKTLRKQLRARWWAACLEVSMHAASAASTERVHLHTYLYWTDNVGIYRRNLEEFRFQNTLPNVQKSQAKKKITPKAAAEHGMWYVSLMKTGTLFADTNFREREHYKPRRAWLDSLYEEGKVSHERYQELSAHFPIGYASRKRDTAELMKDEHDAAVCALVKREQSGLVFAGWKTFQEVYEFEGCFDGAPRQRRPILAVVGGTGSGKSLLGASILLRLAKQMGLESFLEITVEGDAELDLRDLRVNRDNGVFLDGVGDVMTLKRNRETLQSRPKVVKGGRSATMMYAYNYTLCRRAVVATLDLSASNLHMLTTDHWLKERKNVIVLRLSEPAWIGATPAPAVQPAEQMKAWCVAEVADFLRSADLEGPAAVCHANGVNGSDLQ